MKGLRPTSSAANALHKEFDKSPVYEGIKTQAYRPLCKLRLFDKSPVYEGIKTYQGQ